MNEIPKSKLNKADLEYLQANLQKAVELGRPLLSKSFQSQNQKLDDSIEISNLDKFTIEDILPESNTNNQPNKLN